MCVRVLCFMYLCVDGVLFVLELMLLFVVVVRLAGACMSVSVRCWSVVSGGVLVCTVGSCA